MARVAAVIGDGALTGGVAYEALHAAGGLQTPIVIVLNDNGMSISPNVGALSRYFNRVRLNPRLYHAREGVEDRLTKLPLGLGRRIERLGPEIKSAIKAYWAPGLFFEELDLAYMGVIDGHDVGALRAALREAFEADRPVVVHIHTVKGKGFAPAEEGGLEGMERWHAAKPNSIINGSPAEAGSGEGVRLAGLDRAGAAGEAAAPERSAPVHEGLRRGDGRRGRARSAGDRDHRGDGGGDRPAEARRSRSPASTTTSGSPSRTRCCSPAGWPCRGQSRSARSTRPSSSAPTTRSSTTSACRSLDVTFAMDRAGLVGDDGPTHHGAFDISYFRPIPNVVLMAPRDEAMLVHMLHTALAHPGPAALRYPRGAAEGVKIRRSRRDPDRKRGAAGERGAGGAARLRLRGRRCARGGGDPRRARPAADRRRRPLREAARRRAGGAAGARTRLGGDDRGERAAWGFRLGGPRAPGGRLRRPPRERARVLRVGLPDRYVTHGKPSLLRAEAGLTGESVAERVLAALHSPEPVLGWV